MKDLKNIGKSVKMARIAAGESQAEFGKHFGLGHAAIGVWERTGNVPKSKWHALFNKYGVDVGALMNSDNVQTISGDANMTARGGIKNAQIIKGEVLSTTEKALVEALRTLGESENNFIYSILGKIAEMQK